MYRHLISKIPNYRIFRWFIKYLNGKMKKSDSMFRLKIRYRVPKKNLKYGWGGSLKCTEAKRFSVYLRRK